ncbi:MAG: endonuclease dU [Candidatus Bathyarchaeaceae archaeon]
MALRKFRHIKHEIRVLGVDDGIFVPHTKGKVDVIGVVYRGGQWLDGVMRTEVAVDGMDATEKIASMIKKSPHYNQIRVVVLDGITYAGFNVVDINELFKRVNLPVIAVTREKPDLTQIKKALKNLPESEKRWNAIESAGKIIEVRTRNTEEAVYMQIAGISQKDAEKILRNTSTRSNIPEALRVAHIIASGLARSEEKI